MFCLPCRGGGAPPTWFSGALLLCLIFVGGPASGRCLGLLGRLRLPFAAGAPLPQGRRFHRICAVATGAGLLPQGLGRLLLLFLLVWEARPRGDAFGFWGRLCLPFAAGAPLPHGSVGLCCFVCFLWEARPRGDALVFFLAGCACLSRRGRRSHKGAAPTRAIPTWFSGAFLLCCFLWEARPRGDAFGFGAGVACHRGGGAAPTRAPLPLGSGVVYKVISTVWALAAYFCRNAPSSASFASHSPCTSRISLGGLCMRVAKLTRPRWSAWAE